MLVSFKTGENAPSILMTGQKAQAEGMVKIY
jgi:hypothetical protein